MDAFLDTARAIKSLRAHIKELRAENARLRNFAQRQIDDNAKVQEQWPTSDYGRGVRDTMEQVAQEAREALEKE